MKRKFLWLGLVLSLVGNVYLIMLLVDAGIVLDNAKSEVDLLWNRRELALEIIRHEWVGRPLRSRQGPIHEEPGRPGGSRRRSSAEARGREAPFRGFWEKNVLRRLLGAIWEPEEPRRASFAQFVAGKTLWVVTVTGFAGENRLQEAPLHDSREKVVFGS